MQLDILVGGMPRGGTTIAAKFLSLHPDIFCYAGETHLIPFMHGMFGQMPCRDDKVDLVSRFLRQQFMTAMVEMPRFSVSQGAHPGNLIFSEQDVDDLVEALRSHLHSQLYGLNLHRAALVTLRELLVRANGRIILGEKTPSNIFAMAEYSGESITKNVVVMREPIGVLRSMRARVEGGDDYSNAFKGALESNIGMYLEYATAARAALKAPGSLLVRFEDMAADPATVVKNMFQMFDREPEERVTKFVENGLDREIANRAPVNYRRLSVKAGSADLSPVDVWKIFSLTRELRDAFGYSDADLTQLGFNVSTEWPDVDVPSQVLPLSGFHQEDQRAGTWMKRKGSLIVYLDKVKTHDISLELKSNFPEQVEDEVLLRVSVNNTERKALRVKSGKQTTVINVAIHADELVPMGTKGGYGVIGLESSIGYTEIGHTAKGVDACELSFQLKNWKINKKSFSWWW